MIDKLVFVTENIEGEKYAMNTDTQVLLHDWEKDADICPSNDAKIFYAAINNEPMYFENFGVMMEYIKTGINKSSGNPCINTLSEDDKDKIYREVWQERVKSDITSFMEDNYINGMPEDIIEDLSNRYVNGHYDCCISYWDNIENLLNESEEYKNKRLMNKISEVFEDEDIKADINENHALIEFWTDSAGQDIVTEIDYDGTPQDLINQFVNRAESYDVDDEVELFVTQRGKNGIPNTVRELLDDCQEAKDTLMKLANNLKKL